MLNRITSTASPPQMGLSERCVLIARPKALPETLYTSWQTAEMKHWRLPGGYLRHATLSWTVLSQNGLAVPDSALCFD